MSVVAASGLLVPHASADQLSDLRAKAQALAARIQSLQIQDAALGEQYDAATLASQAAQAKVNQAAAQVTSADASADKAKSALRQEAVDAYTQGGNGLGGGGTPSLSTADSSLLRAEYVESLATDQNDAMDGYHLASLQAQSAKASLTSAQHAAATQAQNLAASRTSVEQTQTQMQAAYQQDQGQIAQEVAQIQAAQAAAAAKAAQEAAQQRAAATAAAAAAAQQAATASANARSTTSSSGSTGRSTSGSSGSSTPAPVNNPAPPVGAGASGAVAAAMTRLGDPYVYGAAGPSTFDCSGLVMWAYDQVGISLPHYSGAQYADSTHISMSQLEPGDLVFPANPGEHVAMYIGGGNIIEAPYTGAVVHVTPLSSFFVLAARVS